MTVISGVPASLCLWIPICAIKKFNFSWTLSFLSERSAGSSRTHSSQCSGCEVWNAMPPAVMRKLFMAANWRFDLELALLNQGKQMSSKSKLVPKTSGAILSSFLIFQAIACSSPTTPPQLAGSSASRNAYNTAFPLQENPISEGGKWIGGQSAGRNLWGDVQTKENFAFGVSEPTKFGDPTAILAGLWGPDQTVSGVVRIATTPTGQCCREVELRLRATISNDGITGYEAYCSVMPVAPYCHIARWNGPNGRYCNIDSSTPVIYAVDGDVLTAKVTGTNPTI